MIEDAETKIMISNPITPKKEPAAVKADVMWQSCSGCELDPRVLLFFTSFIISVGVIVFCIYEISLSKTCEATTTFMNLLMFILGVWVPRPSLS
jgi:hypothetical protein